MNNIKFCDQESNKVRLGELVYGTVVAEVTSNPDYIYI